MKSSDLLLAINAGSSSLKASVVLAEEQRHFIQIKAERLHTKNANICISTNGTDVEEKEISGMGHKEALIKVIDALKDKNLLKSIVGVGHRVVHGGSIFNDSVLIDDDVVQEIESMSHLAPLHNPTNLECIKTMRDCLPDIPNVAVFDTSFHMTLPERAHVYAIPKQYRDKGIRKYGFHGTSVRYVCQESTKILNKSETVTCKQDFNFIVCHLGSGASVTAVANGKSVDTSMGFSPLAGLVMGTRSGSIDPAVIPFAAEQLGKSAEEVVNDLNNESGLKGIVGNEDYDMRNLLHKCMNGDSNAILAVEIFAYRLAQHVASSIVALPGPVDAMIFTAGIGEHSGEIRKRCIDKLGNVLKINLDDERNQCDGQKSNGILTKEGSHPLVLDVATDEELMIARDVCRVASL